MPRVTVRVTPRSGRDEIIGWDPHAQGTLLVRVCAPPEGGKANKAVRDLLARSAKVPKTSVELVKGDSSRTKVFDLPLAGEGFQEWSASLPMAGE